MSRSWRLF